MHRSTINLCSLLIGLILALSLACFVSFYNLTFFPIRVFDESRQAISAIEMFKSHNFLFTTFDNEVDFWNTKPPLLVWLQVLFMHLFGIGELAIRLPSALAAIGILGVMLFLSKTKLENIEIGIVAAFCLFTSQGFVAIHSIRTGDYDALLAFLLFCWAIAMYNYIIKPDKKYLLIGSIVLTLAILCKSIAAFFFVPGVLIYLLITKKLSTFTQNRLFWYFTLIPIFIGLGYYPCRELLTPGYLHAVWLNELGGRFSKVNEGNTGSWRFYIDILMSYKFGRSLLLLALACLPISWLAKSKHSKFALYLSCLLLAFLTIISISKTKLPWYLTPAYPLLSLMLGISFSSGGQLVSALFKTKTSTNVWFILPLAVLFYGRTKTIISQTYNPQDPEAHNYILANYLKEVIKEKHRLDAGYTFVNFEHYYPQYKFYLKVLEREDVKIENFNYLNTHFPKKIATGLPEIKQNIEESYEVLTKTSQGNFTFYSLQLPENKIISNLTKYNIIIAQKNGLTIRENFENPTRILIENTQAKPKDNYFFYFKTKNDSGENTEVIEMNPWQGLEVGKKSYRFIQLRGHYKGLTFGQKNVAGKELWKSEVSF
jgi:4-amino-4-deoxy-L-arabinose transferase-like glycosyltransferase